MIGEGCMKKHNEKAIQVMKAFVEGEIDINAFKYEYDNSDIVKETLRNDPLCPRNTNYLLPGSKDIIEFLDTKDWMTIGGQLSIWGEIERFLSRYNYPYEPTMYYDDRYGFLLDIQPRWLDIRDEDFLNTQVISKAPEGLTKAKRIAWCKEKLKQLFRYEKSYPRWVQSPEWPILDGVPLVFKKQLNDKKDSEKVNFIFYNPDTMEEHVVTQ